MIFRKLLKEPFPTEGGFTLIEVIVALTIMSLVVTVAFSGLSIAIDSWERGSHRLDELDRRVTVERLLKRQLAVASPARFFQLEEETFGLFRGSEQRLEFISDYSLADGSADYRKIDYFIRDGGFYYGETPLFDYTPAENEREPVRLLAKFSRVSFQYLGSAQNGALEWMEDWEQGTALPRAVRAQIEDDVFVIPIVNR
jgi:general secretion pathway protein J